MGLFVAVDDNLLVKLMLNIATCYISMHAHTDALRWAAAVTSVSQEGPLAAKAWFRIAQALDQQQLYNSARIMYKHAAELHKSCGGPSAEALQRLKSLPSDDKVAPGKDSHRLVLSQVRWMNHAERLALESYHMSQT
jgi:tetratricopeptide (TPR) repeat protein